MYAIVKGAYCM